MTDTGTLPRPQAGRGGADEGAVGPRCWHSQGPYPPLSYMELSFHDHISATCPSAQKALVICVCVGGGERWSFCGTTPLPTLLHKLMLVFVVNPVTEEVA